MAVWLVWRRRREGGVRPGCGVADLKTTWYLCLRIRKSKECRNLERGG
jgi:hypothetical protein